MEGSRNLVMSTWGLDRRDGMETMAGGGRFTFCFLFFFRKLNWRLAARSVQSYMGGHMDTAGSGLSYSHQAVVALPQV